MNTREPLAIPDIQSSADTRKLAIDRVGIQAIRHPIRVSERGGGVQHTIELLESAYSARNQL